MPLPSLHLPQTQEALDAILHDLVPYLPYVLYVLAAEKALALLQLLYNLSSNLLSSPRDPPAATLTVPQRTPPPPLIAAEHHSDGKPHLLLACTGSVATIKLPNMLSHFASHPNLSVRVILSRAATAFLQGQADEQPSLEALAALPNVDGIYLDEDEWARPWKRGDAILHIELRRWADLLVVAPLSANALGKVAGGVSDDLVSSVVRAWDAEGLIDVPREGAQRWWLRGREGGGSSSSSMRKGILVAPAMNTAMWRHPVTARQVAVLEGEWGVANGGWIEVLRPVEKELACGDTGSGAMKDWREIVAVVGERLSLGSGWQGKADGGVEGRK